MQLCRSILERFNSLSVFVSDGFRLGPDYSLPRIKNNYKGQTIAPVLIPSVTSTVFQLDGPSVSENDAHDPPAPDLVTPIAGFVLKTRRSDGQKIFINVCSHSSVPVGVIITSPEGVEIPDKDGSMSLVYDACCDSELMSEISSGSKDRQDEVSLLFL